MAGTNTRSTGEAYGRTEEGAKKPSGPPSQKELSAFDKFLNKYSSLYKKMNDSEVKANKLAMKAADTGKTAA